MYLLIHLLIDYLFFIWLFIYHKFIVIQFLFIYLFLYLDTLVYLLHVFVK